MNVSGVFVSGKPDASSVVYRVGECMQELIKLWREYESSQADKICESSQNGPTIEIRIPAEHVTATNRQQDLLSTEALSDIVICYLSFSISWYMINKAMVDKKKRGRRE
ncbi:unnamed protein product [Ilex paraguariensis]|uniref:Uncharacterized protein n=1 Tax=Ilex paraguariensis TaxID=185542 RepID=A0ABC8SN65_9AQUA